jgi:hypothetical protein
LKIPISDNACASNNIRFSPTGLHVQVKMGCDKEKQINLEHKEILPDMATVLPHAFFLNMTTCTET